MTGPTEDLNTLSTRKLSTNSRKSALVPPREHKSSFAGSRQASEESRNIRFLPTNELTPTPIEKNDWKNRVRRISRVPTTMSGLTRIRVGGHLNYSEIVKRAERQSTWHGISHAALAPNTRWRHFWHTVFIICFVLLIIQVIFLIAKYRSYGKTVDLDLKFENAPFPSITLCNLNPYKKSMIMNNPSTKSTIDAFSNLLSKGDQSAGVAAILANRLNSRKRRNARKARRKEPRRYHQVFAQCLCTLDPLTGKRKGSCFAAQRGKISGGEEEPANFIPSRCLCQFDATSRALWPCFPYNSWKEKLCAQCVDDSGHCPMRFYRGNATYENIKDEVDLCLCHKEYNHCVANNDDGVIPEIDPDEELSTLDFSKKSLFALEKASRMASTTTTTQAPEIVQALGFGDVKDEIAITTVAQQNLMFAVGEMKPTERVELSHKKEDFILKCSFNQKDCNVEEDFKLHYDQTYGNCYTFNWNRTAAVTSHRAGANYGLRVLLYADVEEYLPTSESVGFRITVHDKWIVPFPDAFGYNAPTGFLSSFGVRMKQFLRISAPHGHCKPGGEDGVDFIYTGFNYSVEACHRSCTQKKIAEICGCSDPMYPTPKNGGIEPCRVTDTAARDCIRNTTIILGQKIAEGSIEDCHCHQPCAETNYEVTYSAARWPSGAAKVMECLATDHMCLEKYRRNAALLQIFYEELNYETMIETEAYSLSSFIADLGGVTGLWVGASVVSLMEIVTLVVFAAQTYVRNKKELGSDKSLHNSNNTLHKLSIAELQNSFSTHSSKSRGSIHSQITQRSLRSQRSRISHKSSHHEEAIEEGSDDGSSSHSTQRTHSGSLRYIAPGEDLPCICKYNEMGHIIVMKALCPIHGYMVRRNYDYSLSNSEESEENDPDEIHTEEPYYQQPFSRSMSKKKRSKSRGVDAGEVEEALGDLAASTSNQDDDGNDG